MESYVRGTYEVNGPLPPSERQRQLANDPIALIAWLSGSRCTPTGEQLATFDKPAFIYVGEADPRIEPSKAMASQLLSSTPVTLPAVNHLDAFLRSELILPHLIQFLLKVS
jgi:hypothetical protein